MPTPLDDWLRAFLDVIETPRWREAREIQARSLTELYAMRKPLGPVIYEKCLAAMANALEVDLHRLTLTATLADTTDIIKALGARPKCAPKDSLFPTTGWLAEYLAYTAGNEVPLAWHFWCGMSVLASALKRNLFLDAGAFEVWPNLYLMIVEEAASRKSTAIKFSKGLVVQLNRILEDTGAPPGSTIPIAYDSGTPTKFLEQIKSVPVVRRLPDGEDEISFSTATAYFAADDLVTLFSKSNFNPDKWVEILTHLWDHKGVWREGTVGRGEVVLKDPAITFVGGTTLEWMRNNVTESMVGGGFMSRCIYVVNDGAGVELYSRALDMDPVHAVELASKLVPFVTMDPRQCSATDDYWDWYDKWYRDWVPRTKRLATDTKLRAYYGRRTTMLHKIAMLLVASEVASGVRKDFVLTPADGDLADRIMAREERMLPGAFKSVSATNDALLVDFVERLIERKGGTIKHSLLLNQAQYKVGSKANLARLIETLVAMERITVSRNPKTGGVLYTTKLVSREDNDEEMESSSSTLA